MRNLRCISTIARLVCTVVEITCSGVSGMSTFDRDLGGALELVAEAVREALGTDDPTGVKGAVAGDREGVWLRVRDQYLALARREVPKKKPGEYVPAWFLEQGPMGGSDGAAQYFVARALLYAHRVAVVDSLAYYCDEAIMMSNEHMRDNLDLWRDSPPHDFDEILTKVLVFAPLEELGLLHYLTPPLHEDRPKNADGWGVLPSVASDDELELYFKQHLSRRGHYFVPDWTKEGDARIARNAAAVELGHTAIDLDRALRFFLRWHDHADLYTSGYPSYRDGIQFLMRLRGQTLFVGAPNEDSTTLDALWSLPGFSGRALRKLTVQDLLDMRDDQVFRSWRSTLQDATTAYNSRVITSPGERQFSDFLELVRGAEGALLTRARSRRSLERALGDVRDFGISVAMGSATAGAGVLLSSGEMEPALVSGAVGVIASQLPAIAGIATDAAKGGRRKRAVERHVALFGS